ncbi:MiaB/RimO family radical SAM methylthiotransferase, partial [Thermodesulfobacteriota bacterium]
MPRYYHIITMGCQMNEYDSDYLAQILLTAGYIPTDDYNNAQLILINTCTVRAKAQQKAVSLLGRMVYVKRRNPDLILGVMGCIAQQEGSRLIDRFPEIDLVLGTRETGNILEYLDNIEGKRKNVVATDISLTLPSLKNHQGYFKGRLRSFIAVMEGCDNFCSYCIVPYVRGRETSRLPGDVIEEAEDLLSEGVKEVTLLGQNVNSYLSKGEKDVNFPDLLRMLSKLDGLERIRFTTSHPKDLSRDMIQCFGELDNLCPHIHLPFQSGSNRILKMMNRGYTREQYLDLIRQLR